MLRVNENEYEYENLWLRDARPPDGSFRFRYRYRFRLQIYDIENLQIDEMQKTANNCKVRASREQ